MPSFPTISIPEPKWKWLSEEQQAEIFKHIPKDDLPIFVFMSLHGVRPGEARALKVSDVNFNNQSITIQRAMTRNIITTTKNKKIRVIPIHPDFIDNLKKLCQNKLPSAFVFTYSKTKRNYSETVLRTIWKKATKKAGIEITMYEALRHSWASQRVGKVPLYLISKALGHSDLKVTQRYAHTNIDDLRACFKPTQNDNQKVVNFSERPQKLSPDRPQNDFEG